MEIGIVRPVDIVDEMRTAYLEYAMSVIVSRALPDARDGLKPVQRRIMYAMWDMGIRHDTPYKKCARIVGECFVPGTLVLTERGLLPIEDVERGDIVFTQSGKAPVTELYEMPERDLLKITLENGTSVTVTPAQPLKVLGPGMRYYWKKASEIGPEDHLVVRASYPEDLPLVKLPDWQGRPLRLNYHIGYLMGQFLSDGWFEEYQGRFCFYSTSQGVIRRVEESLVKGFGYQPSIERIEREVLLASGERRPSIGYQIRVNSQALNEYLSSVFSIDASWKAPSKRIPRLFFQSPKPVLIALLSGLIDGDGSIHASRRSIHYGSVSEGLVDDLQLLLQHLGVLSARLASSAEGARPSIVDGREIQARYPFFSLEVRGHFARKLGLMLALAHEQKTERVCRMLVTPSKTNTTHYDRIPHAGEVVFAALSASHQGGGWYSDEQGHNFRMGVRHATGNKIRYSADLQQRPLGRTQIVDWGIAEKLERIGSPLSPVVSDVVRNDIYFLRVARVEAAPAQKTYDLQVAGVHEFVANGVVSHNCLGKMHPHGDTAVYDALARLTQEWNIRYPLVDGQGNFGCFTGDTKIKLLDGTERTFAELAELPSDEIFYVYSVDANGKVVVGEGRHSRITRHKSELVELTLDNGAKIRCTPDHRFMLRDGTYKQAKDLTTEDSLMPGYFNAAPVKEGLNEYLQIMQPASGEYEFVHHIADRFNYERGLAAEIYGPFVRHHKNFNRWDNRPTNLERMDFLAHLHLHAEHLGLLWEDEAFREAQRQGVQRYYSENPEVIEERRERLVRQNQDEQFRRENGARISSVLKQRFQQNPELGAEISRRMKELWADPEYRLKMRSALAGIEKRELSAEEKERIAQIISEKSKVMWADERKRVEISSAIAQALASHEVRAKLSENARRLWQDPAYRAKYPDDHFARMAHTLWANPQTADFHREKIAQQREDQAFQEAQRAGVRQSNARRMQENPAMMTELTARASQALTENWGNPAYKQQVMRQKIAGYVSRLLTRFAAEDLSPTLYDEQRDATWIPRFDKAIQYFQSFDHLVDAGRHYNHRIVTMRWLEECADVYDITVDVHHNFLLADGVFVHNSVDGDAAAAMRYTEARIARVAEELLFDIEKETVDFGPNFDGSYQEPLVLPARLPALLLNGAAGIAVGMATNIPPHNLNELCDGLIYLIDNPEATVEDLMERIPGPDFPTGGAILGREGIVNAYSTGKGHLTIRAKAHIEEAARGSFHIIVTELPYQVNKARMIERIAELVKDRKIEGIRDVRDESDRSGMRVVIMLKQDAQPKKVLNHLFKYTQMQTTFGVNMLALVDGGKQPRVLTLKKALQEYVAHRQIVIRRRTEFELRKAKERAHILEGLKVALDNLDEVIALIRSSRTTDTARTNLMRQFKLSERQANAILEMQLRRLAALERKKIEDEYNGIIKLIASLEDILGNPRKILHLIKVDLAELKEKYGDVRRTRIISDGSGEISTEDLIPDLQVLVTLTDRNYIKRLPVDTYRVQHRGGRGIKGHTTKEDDVITRMLTCNTMDDLLFFTNKGKVYQLKAHEVPDASRTAKGLPLVNLVSLQPGEQVTSMIAVPNFDDGEYLVMATVQGRVKRTSLEEYSLVRSNGLIAISLLEGDELSWVRVSNGNEDVFMTSAFGQTIRFSQDDVRPMGRDTQGVIGFRLDEGDYVVSMDLFEQGKALLVLTANGMGKRTNLDEYPRKGRGTSGVVTIKLKPKDKVGAARVVSPDDFLTVITRNGIVMRTRAAGIQCYGRATQGVTIMNLAKKDYIAAVAVERAEDATEGGSDDIPPASDSASGVTLTA